MNIPNLNANPGCDCGQPDFVAVAELLGDRSRATLLLELLGGRALPASELARVCRITPQTVSSHLTKLTEGGLLEMERCGRHRYYRLASPEVAQLLETMSVVAPRKPVTSLRQSDDAKRLRLARTCYDHLAGQAGVALADRMLEMGWVAATDERQFELTEVGIGQLADFGLDIEGMKRSKRRIVRACLDWSERRHHVAGAVGAALTDKLFELNWIRRYPAGRAVALTPEGAEGLKRHFGLDMGTGIREQV